VGNNGAGKTNILDALHYLSMAKSFLGNLDAQNILHDSDFFAIEAEIQGEEKNDIIKVQLPKEGKKIIKKNDKTYERIADHIGFLPSVMISPYDANLISDGSESRRKFLDAMISQTDSDYLFALIQYQKTLQQRNALLKYFAKNRTFDLGTVNVSKSGFDKDFMYSGNMGLWKKFGNSLKLKLAMNLADVDPVLSKSTAESAFLGGVMTSQDQSAYCSYPGGLFPNPIYADVIQSGRKDYVASNTLVDAMKADNDPRLSKFFKPADGETDIVGGVYGTNNDYYAFAHISDKVTAANAPAYILDYAEVSLLLAEAASRGYSVGDTAENYYIQGVSASMDFWGVSSSDKAAYLAAHPYVSTDWKTLIGKQSWYALYNRGHEAWTFNRRLDYPKFLPSAESVLSKVPTRMNYPATEQQINGANWKVAADKITGGDKATSKVFWDKF
jgi:hypothetical protein